MSTNTTHFDLVKPGVNDPTDQDLWGGMLNEDLDDIDSIMWSALNFVHSNKVATFTATDADYKKLFLCDATAGAITANLPPVADVYDGFTVAIKRTNSGANAVTIDGDGSETIDGATTLVLSAQYQYVILVANGTSWSVISGAVQDASTTQKGIIEIATDAEFKAGTATDKAVVPSNFASGYDLTAAGYYTFPGGFTWQWGITSPLVPDGVEAVTFEVPFTTIFGAQATLMNRAPDSQATASGNINNVTITGMDVIYEESSPSPPASAKVYWMAYGVV